MVYYKKYFISVLGEMDVELPDELLDTVTGGYHPRYEPMRGIWVKAEAVCTRCQHPFTYWYWWGEFGQSQCHNVPQLCPTCDPSSAVDLAETVGR